MKCGLCGLYGLYFDDVRDQVRWLPAPCVLGIYIYIKKKNLLLFWAWKSRVVTSPLLQDLKSSVQGWIGKHLTYAGRLELLRTVLFGKVHFWLNIFPIWKIVMRNIISICRNFLWTGDVRRGTTALVAWKTICMPKAEGGLGLFDLRARNRSFLGKKLWNIHLKTDSVWIRWVHHFYLSSNTI